MRPHAPSIHALRPVRCFPNIHLVNWVLGFAGVAHDDGKENGDFGSALSDLGDWGDAAGLTADAVQDLVHAPGVQDMRDDGWVVVIERMLRTPVLKFGVVLCGCYGDDVGICARHGESAIAIPTY